MKRNLLPFFVSFAVPGVVFATAAGARSDARHAWAVHDEHRPNPPAVATEEGRPPSDAVVLFDGTPGSIARNWTDLKGGPSKWTVRDGLFVCVPGSGMVQTRESFGDVQLHVEWLVPPHDPHFGNSGVFLMGRYEVQILDSFGVKTDESPMKSDNYADGQAGALYGQSPPAVNAARPAGRWQSYDIVFHPPYHENGVEKEPATITVFHNGVLVQDNWRLEGPTTWGARVKPKNDGVETGPIQLQDHGTPVPFRNVWVRRIASPRANTTGGGAYVKEEDVAALRGQLAQRTLAQAEGEKDSVKRMLLLYESVAYRSDEAVLARARAAEDAVEKRLDAMDSAQCRVGWRLVDDLGWWEKMTVREGLRNAGTPLGAAINRACDRWKNDVSFTSPDFTVYSPALGTDHQVNEHFHVLPSPKPGVLHAFWTQESWEGASDMHVMSAKSPDGGRTWSKPVLFRGSSGLESGVPNAVWQLPFYSKSGRLYVLWNEREKAGGGQGVGYMKGAYSDDEGETWSEPEILWQPRRWCSWQRPLRLAKDGRYLTAVSISTDETAKTCFLRFENVDDDPAVRDLKLTLFMDGEKTLEGEEASIVKLPDGRLFAVMRSGLGYPLWTESRDGGETWSASKPVKDADGRVVVHPRSPCPLYDFGGDGAASGRYFALFTDRVDPKAGQWEGRGPLYLYRGVFDPKGEQPVRFEKGEVLLGRSGRSHYGNSCYSSCTAVDGTCVLWYPDNKFHLLGRVIK